MENSPFRLTHQTRKLNLNGKFIQTYSFGTGEKKVLALPSFPHSGIYYGWLFHKHDLSNLTIVSFDFPGWIGKSDKYYSDNKYSLEAMVELAKQVVNAYGFDKFRILGYSFGASLGVRIASDWYDRVTSLVLVSAVICGDKLGMSPILYKAKLAKIIRGGWAVRLHVLNMFAKYKRGLDGHLDTHFISLYKEMFSGMDNNTLLESIYSVFFTDWSEYLKNIKDKKVLAVNSIDEDKLFRDQAKYIRTILINEDNMYIHGTHDDFMLKPNDNVVEKIAHFLESN